MSDLLPENWATEYVRVLSCRGGPSCGQASFRGADHHSSARKAAGHSILVAAYRMLRDGVPYQDLGPEQLDHLATDRLTRHYVHRLEQLGHRVTLQPGTDVV